VESAYGAGGHWLTSLPAEHFRTAATSTSALAELISAELRARPEIGIVVDLGAGDGTLLNQFASQPGRLQVTPDRHPGLRLYGVDLRSRPDGLGEPISWCRDVWDVTADRWTSGEADRMLAGLDAPALVIAVEWLDDLPCVVAERASGVLREVDINRHGVERAGGPLTGDPLEWADRWWPSGPRMEIGLSRDRAWFDVVAALRRHGGLALMIDYGHRSGSRPNHGSLTGYAHGRQLNPRPDASMNLTAHVAVDAVRWAGEQAGARTVRQARLAEMVAQLPAVDPADPLAALAQRSERAALASGRVWGGQYWLLQQVTATPTTVRRRSAVVD
jgi:SAM-dependent MidA family methyltransferase